MTRRSDSRMKNNRTAKKQIDTSLLVYAFFIIAVVVYFFDQSREGKLIVSSSPSGARVYLDNKDYGKTPLETIVKRGEYGIKVISEGCFPLEQRIVIEAGKTTSLNLQLKRTGDKTS